MNEIREVRFLSSIALKQAFLQIPLDESSRPKTAFSVHGRGLLEFKSMPFDLSRSFQTMSRLMDMVIGPSLEPYALSYLIKIKIK